jgi:hypothetical protein
MLHNVNSWYDVLNWLKNVTKSSRMVWQEVITDLWSFYTWIGLKFQRTTVKILVCMVFKKDVCVTNTDICELWTNLWIMKFKVFTAVLLKTNLQVCVLFNEKWEGCLVSNVTTWYTLLQSWFDILIHTGSKESAYLSVLSERKVFTVSDLRACWGSICI